MTVLRFCDCYTNLDRECVDVCVVDKRFWFRSSPRLHVYGYFTKLTFSSVFWFLSFTIVATNTDGNGLFWLYSWWGRPEIINHQLLLDLLDWFDLILLPFLSFLFTLLFWFANSDCFICFWVIWTEYFDAYIAQDIAPYTTSLYCLCPTCYSMPSLQWNKKAFLTVSLRQMHPVFHFAA